MASGFWNSLADSIEDGIEYSVNYLMSDKYWGKSYAGYVADKIITPENICSMMNGMIK